VSTKLIALALFTFALRAQNGFPLMGEVRGDTSGQMNGLEVQLYDLQHHDVVARAFVSGDGRFQFSHVVPGSYAIRLKSSSGADSILEEYRQVDSAGSPLILQLPERAANHPISGVVSLHDLQHPPSKHAVQSAIEAQKYSKANDYPHAIEKLEEAIRIDPSYRDAHTNLGAQYAHAGRPADALMEFRRAFEIGPPDSIICSNLAWAHLATHQFTEAEVFARKALAMDPANAKAQYLLDQSLLMKGH
jgi:tetratricopeptide (TPR) repeat protein